MFLRVLGALVTADWIDRRARAREQRIAAGLPRQKSWLFKSPALWLIRRLWRLARRRRTAGPEAP